MLPCLSVCRELSLTYTILSFAKRVLELRCTSIGTGETHHDAKPMEDYKYSGCWHLDSIEFDSGSNAFLVTFHSRQGIIVRRTDEVISLSCFRHLNAQKC